MAGDDLYEVMDGIKENVFIAKGSKPLVAKKYAVLSANATPVIKQTDEENLRQLYQLARRIEDTANSIKPERRCENVLLDTIADKMAHAETLLEIEMRNKGLNESLIYEIGDSIDSLIAEAEEDIKVEHDHNAVTETPVDRKEVKRAANKLMNEFEDIGLEEKSDRMEVDKKPTYHHKKKMIRKKHGRYS